MYSLLRLAKPWKPSSETKNLLEAATKNHENCHRFSARPLRFEASLPEESKLVFSDETSLGLMFIARKTIPYIVDIATQFSAATFLDSRCETYGQTTKRI